MKRILTVFAALALIIACVPICSSVDDAPTFSAAGTTAAPGESIQVPIRIENNPGIMSCDVRLTYDQSVLTLNSVTNCNLFSSGDYMTSGALTYMPFSLMWTDYEAAHTDSGDYFIATFTVNASAAPGDTVITVSYNEDNTFDFDETNVAFETQNATISIVNWYFTDDCTLYTFECEDSGMNIVGGLDVLEDCPVSDHIITGGGWSYEVVYNEEDQESTGAKLLFYDAAGTVMEEYEIILFGDVNGDFSFDGKDILVAMDMMAGAGQWSSFFLSDEYPQTFAADANHDGSVNGIDILCIMDCMSVNPRPFQFIEL